MSDQSEAAAGQLFHLAYQLHHDMGNVIATVRGGLHVAQKEWEVLLAGYRAATEAGIAPRTLRPDQLEFLAGMLDDVRRHLSCGEQLMRAYIEECDPHLPRPPEGWRGDGGARFRAAVAAAEEAAREPTPQELEIARRALVVDDRPRRRDTAVGMLEDLGWSVAVADHAAAALARCAASPFGLILVDFRLEGMDGVELTRRLRGEPAAPNARTLIVGLIGRDDPQPPQAGMDAGMSGWLFQPLLFDRLSGMIEMLTPARIREALQRAGR